MKGFGWAQHTLAAADNFASFASVVDIAYIVGIVGIDECPSHQEASHIHLLHSTGFHTAAAAAVVGFVVLAFPLMPLVVL